MQLAEQEREIREETPEELRERVSVFVNSLKEFGENFTSFLGSGKVDPKKLQEAETSLELRRELFCERVLEYIKQYYIIQPKKLAVSDLQAMNMHIGWSLREFYSRTNDYAYRNQAVGGFVSIGRLLVSASGLYGTSKDQKIAELNSAAENLITVITNRVAQLNQLHKQGIEQTFVNPRYTKSS